MEITIKKKREISGIQRKPSASDVRSFAAIISPTNGRNMIKVNTTWHKSEQSYHTIKINIVTTKCI